MRLRRVILESNSFDSTLPARKPGRQIGRKSIVEVTFDGTFRATVSAVLAKAGMIITERR
jgi:hypothetical protein